MRRIRGIISKGIEKSWEFIKNNFDLLFPPVVAVVLVLIAHFKPETHKWIEKFALFLIPLVIIAFVMIFFVLVITTNRKDRPLIIGLFYLGCLFIFCDIIRQPEDFVDKVFNTVNSLGTEIIGSLILILFYERFRKRGKDSDDDD